MGLRASFTMDDLGYAEETPELGLYIDYSSGCDEFARVFLEEARRLCPVDTGRLLGSIEADSDGDGCECIADTEYAQYVEYGTCYMDAQPYFEPAIEMALDSAIPYWDDAVDEALEEEEDLLEEMEEDEYESRGDGFSSGRGFFSSLAGGLLAIIIMIPIIFIGLILNDGLTPGSIRDESSGRGSFSGGGGDLKGNFLGIDIEIT